MACEPGNLPAPLSEEHLAMHSLSRSHKLGDCVLGLASWDVSPTRSRHRDANELCKHRPWEAEQAWNAEMSGTVQVRHHGRLERLPRRPRLTQLSRSLWSCDCSFSLSGRSCSEMAQTHSGRTLSYSLYSWGIRTGGSSAVPWPNQLFQVWPVSLWWWNKVPGRISWFSLFVVSILVSLRAWTLEVRGWRLWSFVERRVKISQ